MDVFGGIRTNGMLFKPHLSSLSYSTCLDAMNLLRHGRKERARAKISMLEELSLGKKKIFRRHSASLPISSRIWKRNNNKENHCFEDVWVDCLRKVSELPSDSFNLVDLPTDNRQMTWEIELTWFNLFSLSLSLFMFVVSSRWHC